MRYDYGYSSGLGRDRFDRDGHDAGDALARPATDSGPRRALVDLEEDRRLEDEDAILRESRRGQWATLLVLALACLIGGVLGYRHLRAQGAVHEAADRLHAVLDTHLRRFSDCVFPGVSPEQLVTVDGLRTAATELGTRHGRYYAMRLGHCRQLLQGLGEALDADALPDALQARVGQLQLSILRLDGAWQAYGEHLALDRPADAPEAHALTDAIATATHALREREVGLARIAAE